MMFDRSENIHRGGVCSLDASPQKICSAVA
jgi:hypothetical protein